MNKNRKRYNTATGRKWRVVVFHKKDLKKITYFPIATEFKEAVEKTFKHFGNRPAADFEIISAKPVSGK